MMGPPDKPALVSPEAPLPGARAALLLLLAINLFNYIDRYVLAAVLPKVEVEFLLDDPNAKFKLGLLAAAFQVTYILTAPVFGWLADRASRWLLISVGVILWSLASGASGLSQTVGIISGYWVLLFTRCFVGVGEAAYGPAAPTVISDLYPVARRGRVLAWFYMAIPVGGALGYVLGGLVADAQWLSNLGVEPGDRWRWAFYFVVPPGLLLGLVALWMREPRRGQAEAVSQLSVSRGSWRNYRTLLGTRSYVINTLAMTAMTFANGGVAIWMPYYIWERQARFEMTAAAIQELRQGPKSVPDSVLAKLEPLQGQPSLTKKEFDDHLKHLLDDNERTLYLDRFLDAAGTTKLGPITRDFGALIVVSGLAATLLGGIAGDKLRPYISGAYFLVAGAGMLAGLPIFLLLLVTPFPWAWIFIFLACFCLFFNTGPTNAALANTTHPSIRSAAFAINIFIIHAFGDAISPSIIGAIADFTSLAIGFQAVSVMILASGLLWLWGARYLDEDTALAPTRL